jgi:hypothetical protein
MENLNSFQTLLEILLLVLTLSAQSPLLAIAAAICAIYLLLSEDNNDDDLSNS